MGDLLLRHISRHKKQSHRGRNNHEKCPTNMCFERHKTGFIRSGMGWLTPNGSRRMMWVKASKQTGKAKCEEEDEAEGK